MAEEQKPAIMVKASDMPETMVEEAKELAIEAVTKFRVESEIAAHIKKEMDARHGMLWHCIAGLSFGSFVTHVRDGFVHLKIDAPRLQAFQDLGLGHLQEKWCFILLYKTA